MAEEEKNNPEALQEGVDPTAEAREEAVDLVADVEEGVKDDSREKREDLKGELDGEEEGTDPEADLDTDTDGDADAEEPEEEEEAEAEEGEVSWWDEKKTMLSAAFEPAKGEGWDEDAGFFGNLGNIDFGGTFQGIGVLFGMGWEGLKEWWGGLWDKKKEKVKEKEKETENTFELINPDAPVFSFEISSGVTPRVTSPYGLRVHPTQGGVKDHGGVDLGGLPEGTPIVSTTDGVIESAGYDDASGHYVRMTLPDGDVAVFCHLQDPGPEAGVEIAEGMTIGKIGSSGRSTGAHLHFGIRKGGGGGDFIDPTGYLPENLQEQAVEKQQAFVAAHPELFDEEPSVQA